MGTSVFPTLSGLEWDVKRSPVFDTIVQQSVSGKETRLALQTYPRWKWEVSYSILRADSVNIEFQTLTGFFNSRYGMFDSFLYTDANDHIVSAQSLGIGNGATSSYQLVRTFGGFVEPILAPNIVSAVYLNGVSKTSGYSVSVWGSATPGVLTFTTPVSTGLVITSDFSYYWPCRFDIDSAMFGLFMTNFYDLKKLSFISLKN